MLIGGTRFYERREIKDVLAYLRVFANPNDNVSKKRIGKLGKRRLENFNQFKDSFDKFSNKTIDILDNVLRKTQYLTLSYSV